MVGGSCGERVLSTLRTFVQARVPLQETIMRVLEQDCAAAPMLQEGHDAPLSGRQVALRL